MKKVVQKLSVLTFVGAALFSGLATAQTTQRGMQNLDKYLLVNPPKIKAGSGDAKEQRHQTFEKIMELEKVSAKVQSDLLGSTVLKVKPAGTKWTQTYYDFQTNASMPNRLIYRKSAKTLEAVWMTALQQDWSDRRTRYSAFDAAVPSQLEIIAGDGVPVESDRGGFPSIVGFDMDNPSGGAIGITSHVNKNGTNIKFSTNEESLSEAFSTYDVTKNIGDSTLWARVAIDGKGILHCIYTFSENSPNKNQIAYRRSTDKGVTWSAEQLLTGPNAIDGAKPSSMSADAYAIAARGDVVAISYPDGNNSTLGGDLNWWLRKSTDNGLTWSKVGVIYRTPRKTNFVKFEDRADGIGYMNDTTGTGVAVTAGTNIDIAIDSKGIVHAANTVIGTILRGTGQADNNGNVVRGSDTTLHSSIYYRYGLFYYTETDDTLRIIGMPAGTGWNGRGSLISNRFGQGASRFPQLGMDENDNVYCIYTSIVNDDISSDPVPEKSTGGFQIKTDALYGHIWATHRMSDNSASWSEPVVITPNGVDCIFGSLADDVADGHLFIGFSAGNIPGDRVTESNADGTTEYPVELDEIYVDAFPISSLNAITVGVDDEVISGFNSFVSPNPAQNFTNISYSIPTSGDVKIELYNLMGENIFSVNQGIQLEGSHILSVPTESIPAGAYYFNVIWKGFTITKPVTVVK